MATTRQTSRGARRGGQEQDRAGDEEEGGVPGGAFGEPGDPTDPAELSPLARWLRAAVALSGLSPNAVAKRAGVTHPTVLNLLKDRPAPPGQDKEGAKRDTVRRVARATLPETADPADLAHHVNRGLVANLLLPDPVPGGAMVIVREGQDPVYLPGAPPDEVRALRTGETVELYGTGKRLVLSDEFIKRIELEAELQQSRERRS